MKAHHRITPFIAVVAFLAAFGCTAKAQDTVRTYTVNAAHGVAVAEMPALLVGGYGDGPGRVEHVGPVAVDADGRLYIADNRLRRVTVIGKNGEPEGSRSYSASGDNPLVAPDSIRYVVAMAWRDGVLYLASPSEVWEVSSAGARKMDISSLGSYPRDIAVGPARNVYVLTENYYKIYGWNGNVIDSVGFTDKVHGSPRARSFALSSAGSVYVSARTWGSVLVFGPDGKLVKRIGEKGAEPSQFTGQARGIGVDRYGDIYVRDDGANAVKVFRADGSFVANIGSRGSRPGQSLSGAQVVVDRENRRLILPDGSNYRLQIYDLTGKDVAARNLVVHAPVYPLTHRPSQIALSFGANTATARRIAWKTDAKTRGTRVVFVRTDTGDIEGADWNSPSAKTAEGTSIVYYANVGPYAAHKASLNGLTPGAKYAYRVGDGSPDGWSAPAGFTLAKEPAEHVTVVVLGDSRNRMDVWHDIVTKAAAHDPAFIINTGDLVHDGENMNAWNAWFHGAQDVLATIPLMPSLGNHERQSPNYTNSFALPDNGPPDLRGQCYSFDYGPAHWVVLNTEVDLEEQARWLKSDLQKNKKPWTFAFFHRPAYAGSPSRGDGNADVREAWESILDEYGVDIVWQGHDHYYYRTKPIRAGKVVQAGIGPVYVTTGGAGAPLYPIEKNKYTAVAESVDHYCVLTVNGPASCDVTAYRLDGSVLDRFTISPRRK